MGSERRSNESLWTVTVNVFSPQASIAGVWDEVSGPGRSVADDPPAWLEGRPAGCYFDERDGVHAWLALRLRAHEIDGALQRGQDFVDRLLSRAPADVAGHRRLRVSVSASPATQRSWEREKWLLAPRSGESLPRPVRWSHFEVDADGLIVTIHWSSAQKQPERVEAAENLDRVTITLRERRPPLICADGTPCVSKRAVKPLQTALRLHKPIGRREVCDGFDALPRSTAP